MLTNKEITEIEAAVTSGDSELAYVTASVDNVRALCQTIRKLQADLEVAKGNLNVVNETVN